MAGCSPASIGTTTPPPSSYSLRSRIPVFGPLRTLVGLARPQEHISPAQTKDAVSPTRPKPSSSPLSSSSSSPGYTTPRSNSPDYLELMRPDYSLPSHHCNNEDLKSNAAEMAVRLLMMVKDPVRCPDPRFQAQARTMQIDAVRYMHMALPSDLSAAEAASIRATVPPQILSDQSFLYNDLRPTTLRKTVAQVVALLMALLVFLLPLLTLVVNALLRYERDHHVAKRVVICVQGATRGLGQHGARLQSTLLGFLDSPRGRRLMASGVYLVEGIAGGVMDGCGYQDAPLGTKGFWWTGPQTMVEFPVQGTRGP